METHVNTLISAGADAMTNMFEVHFTLPTGLFGAAGTSAVRGASESSAAESFMVRADGFTPPTPSQVTYTNHWKTVSVDRPATKINLDRTFSITFRVDAYYVVYKDLLRWQAKTMQVSDGFASNVLASADLGTVEVKAAESPVTRLSDVDDNVAFSTETSWKFEDAWIESITPPTYGTSSADPAKVTAKFRFGKYTDPQHNILN